MVDVKSATLEHLLQELNIAKREGDREREAGTYYTLGSSYCDIDDSQQAIEYYTQSLRIAKEVGDREREGSASYMLGTTYHDLGDLQQAIEYYTQSLRIAKAVGSRNREQITFENLGLTYHGLSNFKQAMECHKQALTIAKEVRDRAGEGAAYGNLGLAYYCLGNCKQAMEYHKQALTIAKEVGDRAGEGKACGNLGVAYYGLSNCKQAIEYHKQNLSIAKEIGDRAGEGKAYGNLGLAYYRLGNFKQAIEYHKQNLSIAKEVGDRAEEGAAYGNLGLVYHSLGNFQQAIKYYNQHLSIAKDVRDKLGEGIAYNNLGGAYCKLRNIKQAVEYHKQHLSIAKEVGNRVGEGSVYGNLGNTYCELGDYEQAIEYYKQHLSIAKEIGDMVGLKSAYGGLGNSFFLLGDITQAIEYYHQHLSTAKEIGDRTGEGIACYSLGLAHESLASFSEALEYYRSSVRLFDKTRALLHSEDSWKISFHDQYRAAYTALWRILWRNGKIEEALCAAEQGRAQALMDVLKIQYGVDSLPSASAEAKETISYILNDLPTPTVFVALSGDTISFWVLSKDKRILFQQKRIEHHGDATFLMQTTLNEIGAGVRIKCENRSMDELTDDPPSNREDVEEKKQSWTSSVNSLRPLHDVIIGPIADLLHGDQLIVVPDGPFCLAPYSALSESIRIRVAPSLTTLKLISSSPYDFHNKSGALLVGDPCLEEVSMNLSQLPFAKKEVEMIGKLLKTTPLTGRDATKGEVLKRLASVALVHIAAHGCPQAGEIVLAPDSDRTSQIPRRQDYILTMSDVQAVRLRARLVVLSCCHSGRGEVKSEGVVGIARSFLCAGARSVLVSLWAIDDEATLVFMESFYQHLADGKRASVALHQAMKSLRETEQFSAVKYWAPFVLIGDDITLEFGEEK